MIQSRIIKRLWKKFTPVTQMCTPLYARVYVVVHWITWAAVIMFVKLNIASEFAFTGVILGTLGAAILYRESILSEEEIAIEFAHAYGRTKKI